MFSEFSAAELELLRRTFYQPVRVLIRRRRRTGRR